MKRVLAIFFLFSFKASIAQELFVYTEPASNMAARSIGLRLNNFAMHDEDADRVMYQLNPEIMWGASKNLMLHGELFMSNRDGKLAGEGGSFYSKYRFISVDEVHSHFRMAVFGRYSFNSSNIHQPAIDFNGHNSGYEGGLVATKLVRKFAFSASSSVLYANDNGDQEFFYGEKNRTAFGYTLSVGKLLLPSAYTSYRQTNMNLMLELLGQTTAGNGHTYLDIAPSVQFIVNSRMRFDLGFRTPLVSTLQRSAPTGLLFRFEYNIFNLY